MCGRRGSDQAFPARPRPPVHRASRSPRDGAPAGRCEELHAPDRLFLAPVCCAECIPVPGGAGVRRAARRLTVLRDTCLPCCVYPCAWRHRSTPAGWVGVDAVALRHSPRDAERFVRPCDAGEHGRCTVPSRAGRRRAASGGHRQRRTAIFRGGPPGRCLTSHALGSQSSEESAPPPDSDPHNPRASRRVPPASRTCAGCPSLAVSRPRLGPAPAVRPSPCPALDFDSRRPSAPRRAPPSTRTPAGRPPLTLPRSPCRPRRASAEGDPRLPPTPLAPPRNGSSSRPGLRPLLTPYRASKPTRNPRPPQATSRSAPRPHAVHLRRHPPSGHRARVPPCLTAVPAHKKFLSESLTPHRPLRNLCQQALT